jgi:Tol biopolymer transport system component
MPLRCPATARNVARRVACALLFAIVGHQALASAVSSSLREPEHRWRATLSEGTWLSLDVSPDGRDIVFELLGDLYALPLAGGTARRISSGTAFDSQPRYSPDGKAIVFVSDRGGADNVWVMDPSGENLRALTDERHTSFISPAWTPDGAQVIVSKSTKILDHTANYQLFALDPSAPGSERQLTFDAGDERANEVLLRGSLRPSAMTGVAFGAQANLAYVSLRLSDAWSAYGRWQLAEVNLTTGRITQMTNERGSAMRPTLSPDGRYAAYGTRIDGITQLKLLERASGDSTTLEPALDRDEQQSWSFRRDLLPGMAFTPDSRALIAGFHGKLWRISVPDGHVTPIPFEAAVDIGVAPAARFEHSIPQGAVQARRIETPRISPDGKSVVFGALGRLWIQSLTGRSQPRQLPTGEDGVFFPSWSPDGRDVAYVSWNDLEGGDIWRIGVAQGSQPERLTQARAFYEKIAYSPDGRYVIARRGPREQRETFYNEMKNFRRAQSPELIAVPTQGRGDIQSVSYVNAPVTAEASYGQPHFTADASRVSFLDPVDGLVSVSLDGTDRKAMARIDALAWGGGDRDLATEMLLDPSGKRVAALVNGQIWIAPVDAVAPDRSEPVLLPRDAAGARATRLTREGADFLEWSANGGVLSWALGSTLYRYDFNVPQSRALTSISLQVELPRETSRGVIALLGARVITMREAQVIESADIVITDNRITALGPSGTVTIPSTAHRFDVRGKTVLPGYIDIHGHVFTPRGVHRQQVWEYVSYLAYGVTSIRDPQTQTSDFLTYSDRVAAGAILGPRVFGTGRGVFLADLPETEADARLLTRRYAQFWNTETLKDYAIHGDRKSRQLLMAAAREARLAPTFEANRDLKTALTRLFDGYGGMEHSATTTALYEDVIKLFAISGITYTPTLAAGQNTNGSEPFYLERDWHADAKLKRFYPHQEIDAVFLRGVTQSHPNQNESRVLASQAARIVAAGGRVGLGSHGNLPGLGSHWVMWLLAEGGVPALDVLRIATKFGADAIGHGRDLGSIEVGKLADLQILEGNPLENIRNTATISHVMKDGRLYEANTMNEVWPRRRSLGEQWWWRHAAAEGE